MKYCNGSGDCLIQVDNPNQYEKNPEYSCDHGCKPIPCDNNVFCDVILPTWFLGLKRSGVCLCMSCESMFHKKLIIVEDRECPICMETKTGVVLPNCSHSICVDCFKRCMYGEKIPQPQFPYSDEVLTEWEELGIQDDSKFFIKYPLAKIWDSEMKKWETNQSIKYHQEKSLRLCPYCRI